MTPPCSDKEFDLIIKQHRLSAIFQPVVDFTGRRIKGYEALIRGPSDSALHSPLTLFDTAIRYGRLLDLELVCRETCIRQFKLLNLPGKLFLNVTPETLLDSRHNSDDTLKLLERHGVSPDQIVIELTEHHPLDDYEIMRQATAHYKSMGFQIALDDLGAGYSGLRTWSELDPDYVKIDRHFIQDIQEDAVKREFVRSIMTIAKSMGCEVIAEGIETRHELAAICELGIDLLQGYYFARPRAVPVQRLEMALFECDCGQRAGKLDAHLTESIGALATQILSIPPDVSMEHTGTVFRNAPARYSLPVVNADSIPIGIVRREKLMDLLSTQYGLALHGKKPVAIVMEDDPIIVDKNTSVELVSKLVTARIDAGVESEFIITDQGRYFGLGSVLNLLKKITDLQIRNARYSNPLTLLPGNVPTYEVIDRLLQRAQDFHIAYCDVDNFKPFNDVYGYSKGDQVLMSVAKIITDAIDVEQDYVGHIGGDDFVIIFTSRDWERRCRNILACFETKAPSFYNEEHRGLGGLHAENRTGEKTFIPFLSLSIGAARPDGARCRSHHDVAALATGAKRQAKATAGNCLYIDRRSA
jgi:EAL domain-containing protein (putative c-di-GMP-specific phosphodiesterase class I)/GGDEF domain-containing protein